MLKIRVLGDEKKDVWLVDPGVVIGSALGCGLLLSNPGIKDKHAQVLVAGEKATLKNLCGDGQLLVNGKPAGAEKPLAIGDEINIAGVRLIIVDPKEGHVPKKAAEVPTSAWSIRANHSALNNRIYPITGKMVLGRSNECDITLSVTHLSRKHAELSVVGNKLIVKDLDSANGTFVNGKRIKEETLRKGDELRLDTLSFSVVGPADEMDKTSVRAAITPAAFAAAASVADTRTSEPAPVTKASRPPTPVREAPGASPTPTQTRMGAVDSAAETGGSNIAIIAAAVIAVVAIIAIALYFVL